MKNILKSFSTTKLKDKIKESYTRFPIGFIIILLVTILLGMEVHLDLEQIQENNIIRLIFSLIITFFLSIGVTIFKESIKINGLKKYLLQAFPILFGILFYIGFSSNIDNFENIIFFFLTLVGIISYLFFAAHTKNICNKKATEDIYYSYFYRISTVVLLSSIVGFVLFILGFIGITVTLELFDLNGLNSSKLYLDWTIFALSLFTPIYILTELPKQNEFNKNTFKENLFFSFLIKYIATIFIYIYFIILYAYTVKVLLNFGNWPKGEVTWMVIGFSIFGYITYIFSYILQEKNKFISTFRKAFPFVVIPQVFMLFYAIYLRINQYDLTINRYFVVIFGLWLLIISIYYIFSKRKKLIVIPSLLTLLTIIISVGPWSVYNLPETRQYDRLITNLETAGILENQTIKPLNDYSDIDQELSKNIFSGIVYLCDFDDCNKIKALFNESYKQLIVEDKANFEERKASDILKYKNSPEILEKVKQREYNLPNTRQITNHINEYIKVKSYFANNEERPSISFSIKGNNVFPLDIKGYSNIYNISYRDYSSIGKHAEINLENNELLIKDSKVIINKIDISSIIKKLENNYIENKTLELEKDKLIFVLENYKIVIQSINIKNPIYLGENYYNNDYASGYILEK